MGSFDVSPLLANVSFVFNNLKRVNLPFEWLKGFYLLSKQKCIRLNYTLVSIESSIVFVNLVSISL